MNKPWFKLFSFVAILALLFGAASVQPALAVGEPAAPSDLAAQGSVPGDLAISLSWMDNSTNETIWEIERCSGAGCNDFSLLAVRDATIFGPFFNDVGLAEVTSYSYRVRAVNAAGPSAYSNTATLSTGYAAPNGQIITLTGPYANGAVQLNWTDNATNETRFEIERYEVGAGGVAYVVVGTVAPDTTSFVDTTALAGTSYDYRVVPWRFDVTGGAPVVVNVSTGTGIAGPTNVRAKADSRTSIRITWKGRFAPGTQIVVQRENCDANGCFGWTEVGTVAASLGRFTDTGLAPATTYNYRVRAVSASAVSPFSATVSATTRR